MACSNCGSDPLFKQEGTEFLFCDIKCADEFRTRLHIRQSRARASTMAWLLVARRLPHGRELRDIIPIIAEMVYASRKDATWDWERRI